MPSLNFRFTPLQQRRNVDGPLDDGELDLFDGTWIPVVGIYCLLHTDIPVNERRAPRRFEPLTLPTLLEDQATSDDTNLEEVPLELPQRRTGS